MVQLLRGQTLLCETKHFLLGFASSSAIPGGKEGLSLHLHHKFETNPYTGKCSQSTIVRMGWMQKAQCWLSALHSCDQLTVWFSSRQLTWATPRQKAVPPQHHWTGGSESLTPHPFFQAGAGGEARGAEQKVPRKGAAGSRGPILTHTARVLAAALTSL